MSTTAIDTNLNVLVLADPTVSIDSEDPSPIHVHVKSPFATTSDGTRIPETLQSELDHFVTLIRQATIDTIMAGWRDEWAQGRFSGFSDALIYPCLVQFMLGGKHCTVNYVDVQQGSTGNAKALVAEWEASLQSWFPTLSKSTAMVKTTLAKQSNGLKWIKGPEV